MLKIIAWVFKNIALIVGILEAVLKAAAGIVSLTPTKKDDKIYNIVNNIFSKIKSVLYTFSDKLAGKEITTPNS